MTDQQTIERLAAFMGWENAPSDEWRMSDGMEFMCMKNEWNPLKDWNHTHQVLDKVMEDPKLHTKFAIQFHTINSCMNYMKASQVTLMDTLVSVLPPST